MSTKEINPQTGAAERGRQEWDKTANNSICQPSPAVNPQLNDLAQDIVATFKAMYPESDELKINSKPLWITLWSAPQKESIHVPVFKAGSIPGVVKKWIGQRHVYFAPGLRCANLGRWKAGGNKDVTAIPGLWTEVDIQGPGHVEQALPAGQDEALELAYSIPELPPSLIIHSGGGIYVFWLFKEPWILESTAEQGEAQALLKRFEQTVLKQGSAKGWTLDSVADLRRVLRLPGSLNIKDPDNPKPVKILEYHPERRYNPADFEPYLAELESTVIHGSLPDDEDFAPADLEKILNVCTWMKHCQVDAAQLKEPEWYHMLSVVARCKDPEWWAHELSKSYPGYSEAETSKKYQQAKDRAGPVTCERVRKKLNPEACKACKESVTSPVQLGRREIEQDQPEQPKEEPKTRNGFGLIRICDLECKPPEWLVRDYLEADTLAVAFGDPASGKSFMGIGMGCCIATGVDFYGLPVKQGPVIYIAGEGRNGIARRLKAWEIRNGLDISTAPFFISTGPAALCDPGSTTQVLTAVDQVGKDNPLKLVVIDTLARNFGPGDENSAKDMSAAIQAMDAIRVKHRCTVLIVHHTGHGDKTRERGSIALRGGLDASYQLDKDESGIVRLTPRKMKEAELPEPMAFKIRTVELGFQDDDGRDVTSAVLDRVDYEPPPNPTKSGRGKWQRVARSSLKG